MRPIYDAWLIQIEITNACTQKCANCSRCVGHYQKVYFMDLETVEKAIDSLDGYLDGTFGGGKVGIMGGDPTLHPQFKEICMMLQRKVPAHKCSLWTTGYRWNEYRDIIMKTFRDGVRYNDHSGPDQVHQPVLVAIDEVIADKQLMWELIDNCWVPRRWSASINPKGGFFCEVAAALDLLFEGPGGYPLEKGWWNKTADQFRDQMKRYCTRCSCALPLPACSNHGTKDGISKGNLERLLAVKSPKALRGGYEIYDRVLTREDIQAYHDSWKAAAKKKVAWKPWQYFGKNHFLDLTFKHDVSFKDWWLVSPVDNIRRYWYRTLALFQ